MSSMKLVFPGGEHPQVMLDPGISRIGSDPHANIVLDQPGVLPQHCQLHVTATGVMLEVPHGTTVGVNGQRVDGLIALRPGDSVTFDHVLARLASLESVGQAREASDSGVHRAANDDPGATMVRQVMPMYVLRGLTGGTFGRSYPVHGPLTVGRAPECDICIGDGGLSRLHARLVPHDDGVLIEDLDSTNGSFVNDHRVRRHKACIGDEIGFDKVRFRLTGSGACASDHSGPAHLTFRSPAPGQYAQWARATMIGALLLAMAAVATLAAQYYL